MQVNPQTIFLLGQKGLKYIYCILCGAGKASQKMQILGMTLNNIW